MRLLSEWVDMGLFNRIRPDPAFVSPVRSDPGFVSPIWSDPIRSDPAFVNGQSFLISGGIRKYSLRVCHRFCA